MTSARRYAVYDVFADQVLAGNPLAIVFDADGLDDGAMQKIAGGWGILLDDIIAGIMGGIALLIILSIMN